jgi:hypothetical protein
MEAVIGLYIYLSCIVVPLLYIANQKALNPKPTDWLPYGLKWKKEFKEKLEHNISYIK